MERVAVLTYDLVICKDSNDCLQFTIVITLKNFINRSNSLWKLCLKLRICVRFAAIFNVEKVTVLTITWSYGRRAMIVYKDLNFSRKKIT